MNSLHLLRERMNNFSVLWELLIEGWPVKIPLFSRIFSYEFSSSCEWLERCHFLPSLWMTLVFPTYPIEQEFSCILERSRAHQFSVLRLETASYGCNRLRLTKSSYRMLLLLECQVKNSIFCSCNLTFSTELFY